MNEFTFTIDPKTLRAFIHQDGALVELTDQTMKSMAYLWETKAAVLEAKASAEADPTSLLVTVIFERISKMKYRMSAGDVLNIISLARGFTLPETTFIRTAKGRGGYMDIQCRTLSMVGLLEKSIILNDALIEAKIRVVLIPIPVMPDPLVSRIH